MFKDPLFLNIPGKGTCETIATEKNNTKQKKHNYSNKVFNQFINMQINYAFRCLFYPKLNL